MTPSSLGLQLPQDHYLFSREADQIGQLTPLENLPERRAGDPLREAGETRYSIIDEETLKNAQGNQAWYNGITIIEMVAFVALATAVIVVAGIFLATIYVGPIGLGITILAIIFWKCLVKPHFDEKRVAGDLEQVCTAAQASIKPPKPGDDAPSLASMKTQEDFIKELEKRNFGHYLPKGLPEQGDGSMRHEEVSHQSLEEEGEGEMIVEGQAQDPENLPPPLPSQIDNITLSIMPDDNGQLPDADTNRIQTRLATYDVFRATKKELSLAYNRTVLERETQIAVRDEKKKRLQAINEKLKEPQQISDEDLNKLKSEKKEINAQIEILDARIKYLGLELCEWGFHQYPLIKIHTAFARALALRPNVDISFANLAHLTPAQTADDFVIDLKQDRLDTDQGSANTVIQMTQGKELFDSQLFPRRHALLQEQVDKVYTDAGKTQFFDNTTKQNLRREIQDELRSTNAKIEASVQSEDSRYFNHNATRMSERDLSNLFIQAIDAHMNPQQSNSESFED